MCVHMTGATSDISMFGVRKLGLGSHGAETVIPGSQDGPGEPGVGGWEHGRVAAEVGLSYPLCILDGPK